MVLIIVMPMLIVPIPKDLFIARARTEILEMASSVQVTSVQ